MEIEINVNVKDEWRVYLFILDVSSDDWDVEEVWWVDSPGSMVDPQGTLMFESISEGSWFVRGYGEPVGMHEAHLFYADHESELADAVHEQQQVENSRGY